jgi:predicted nucleic acid-binding protein
VGRRRSARSATLSTALEAHLIVLDASAAIELVLSRAAAASVSALLSNEVLRVPVHFDAEVYGGIRRMIRRRELNEAEALEGLFSARRLRLQRVAIVPLVAQAFALRDRFAAYDAFYAVVARLSGATLVTCDRGLARAANGYCKVGYIALS